MLILVCSFASYAITPDGKYTISGKLKDQATGEDLIGATVYVKELKAGTISNLYGYFTLNLKPGTYNVIFSYIGYESIEKEINLNNDQTFDIELPVSKQTLGEVQVNADKANYNISRNEMSAIKMQSKTIKQIPAFMGEVDIIKAIQLLPGVNSVSEGSSGFSVRGGSTDQNLILLDEATVYNASHLMGFFSVFNNDAIKDVKLYKGDIPARNGGRLSSVLDVRMKDGNQKKFSGSGGIGSISSRLTLEGPIVKDESSFVVSGRRTYADLFLPLAKNKDIRKNKLYFYDLNGKVNHKINDNNRLYLSGYLGHDIFKNEFFQMGFGNTTASIRWNYLFSKRLFSNFTLIYSDFDYSLGVPEGTANSFEWTSHLKDQALRLDFGYYPNINHAIKFGASSTFHTFEPGYAEGLGDESLFSELELPHSYALESGLYVSNDHKISTLLSFKYGLRLSVFQNFGKGVFYSYDQSDPVQYTIEDAQHYDKGELINTYMGFEPRFGMNWQLSEVSSVKASYSRTKQYVHLAQNSTAGTPLDVWFPSSPNVKPQSADQFALGYFRNFMNNQLEGSVEAYYKKMDDAIDFKDHASLLLNEHFERELRFGKATSYGAEFLLRYNLKKLSGWISYTYSHTERDIPDVNNGNRYVAPYDKPHDVAIVCTYRINDRLSSAANWVYSTGAPVTVPTGRFEYGGAVIPVYSDRNAYRMPDYHRLDLSLTYKGKEKAGKKWHGEWNLSVYNAYARKNAWAIQFRQDDQNPDETYAEKVYLFSIIPAITYNFKF